MRIVLANVDYRTHTSSEGEELQRGLEHAGWRLCGEGFDGCRDVPVLLERHKPEAVFVQDKRDWDPGCEGSFRKDIGFTGISALRSRRDILRVCIVKDAGSVRRYHFEHCEEIGADAVMIYYHPQAVLALNPWLKRFRLVRHYHSVDARLCEAIPLDGPRERAIVTGAVSRVYPVRERVFRWVDTRRAAGIKAFGHVGYGNRGSHTGEYLRLLAGYRVHVATASRYGFALRKIIESVAVGATPVTNLPRYDVLPEIDGALARVSHDADMPEVLDAVGRADAAWDLDERLAWARKAWAFYDWRIAGERLSNALATELALKQGAAA